MISNQGVRVIDFKFHHQAVAKIAITPPINTILSWQINTYDRKGQLLTSQQLNDFANQTGPYAEYGYDHSFNPVSVKRCGLQQDSNGLLSPHCVSGSQSFDTLGRPLSVLDNNFYTRQLKYDANGRLSGSTDAMNQWHSLNYDKQGRLVSQSLLGPRANGQIDVLIHNSLRYDVMERPIETRDLSGFATHTQYDALGNISQITNPDGYTVHFEYDKQNRPVKAFDEQDHAVSTQYDIGGRPIKVTDANGLSTTYTYYDAAENGRLKTLTTADNKSLNYFYDNNGNVTRTTDHLGRENLSQYDALNRPIRQVGPLTTVDGLNSIRQVIQSTYNALGDVMRIEAGYTTDLFGQTGSDVLKVQASYTYDDFGRLLSETDAKGQSQQYVYDEHNNLIRKTAANGHIIELSYDHSRQGLLIKQSAKLSASDANPQVTTYAYDALGQTTQVSHQDVTYTYQYDASGRLTQVTDIRGNKSLNYDFSPGGLLNRITDSDNQRTDFLYDAARRLTAILAPNNARVNLVFDAGGRLLQSQIKGTAGNTGNTGNTISSHYQYDTGSRLTQLVNRTSQGIISQHDYRYDSAGRKQSQTETIAGTTHNYRWQYDALDQFTQVLKDNITTEQYSYDAYNNRASRSLTGQSKEFYNYDDAQQLLSIHEGSKTGTQIASFTYDNNGNLTTKNQNGQSQSFTYNALEQLIQITGSNIDTERYTYDPQGRRIEKQVDNDTTSTTSTRQYLYSGQSIHAEFGGDWTAALAYYTYTGLDRAVIRSTPDKAKTRYYHQDGLGSVVAVSDNAGLLQGTRTYTPFGQTNASTGTIPQFGFTGREPDQTGLIFYRNRYYDPSIGRFTQRDPTGFADGINPYVYVGNSPTNYTDPLGLAKQGQSMMSSIVSAYEGAKQAVNNTLDSIDPQTLDNVATAINVYDTVSTGVMLTGAAVSASTGIGAPVGLGVALTTSVKVAVLRAGSSLFKKAAGLLRSRGANSTGDTVDVFRAFGGDARAQGFSWTTTDPRTVSNFRDVAGLPSGGASGATNTANFLIKGKTKVSDIIKSRSALPLDGNKGGLPELIIDPKNVNIIDFSALKP